MLITPDFGSVKIKFKKLNNNKKKPNKTKKNERKKKPTQNHHHHQKNQMKQKKKNPNQTLNTSTIPLGLLHFPEAETEDRITPQIPRDTLTP